MLKHYVCIPKQRVITGHEDSSDFSGKIMKSKLRLFRLHTIYKIYDNPNLLTMSPHLL